MVYCIGTKVDSTTISDKVDSTQRTEPTKCAVLRRFPRSHRSVGNHLLRDRDQVHEPTIVVHLNPRPHREVAG